MQGKKLDLATAADLDPAPATIFYALRLTFGVVHGVILTLFSFALALFFPAFSQFLFGLFGFIVAPLISLLLTIFCNACVAYVSQTPMTPARILKTAWIPPFGVFCTSLILLPLEMMPSLGFQGPMTTLVATSVCVNCIITAILQVYAAKHIQTTVNVKESSSPSPPSPSPPPSSNQSSSDDDELSDGSSAPK